MKFTVDRKTWLRGEGSESSRLLRESDGKRCCLGFVCRQLGILDPQLMGVPNVRSITNRLSHTLELAPLMNEKFVMEFDWVIRAYAVNDTGMYPPEKRERELTALFTSGGHELEFVG